MMRCIRRAAPGPQSKDRHVSSQAKTPRPARVAWRASIASPTADFQLAILTVFGLCAVVAVLPFALYRFTSGQPLAGLIDLGILACLLSAVVYGHVTGRTGGACLFATVASTAGCTAIALTLGIPGLFWLAPVVLANYLLVERRIAALATALALAVLAAYPPLFGSAVNRALFVTSVAMTSLFAYVFAYRAQIQREALESLAHRDALTGAQNRRALEDALEALPDDDAPPPVLAVLDLDGFKGINDVHGHEAGDRVLRAFSDLCRKLIRDEDRFFRLGGEEFVVLMRATSLHEAGALSELLREMVMLRVRCRGQAVTVSGGLAARESGEAWPAWLARADAALYRAKQGGRNRIEVADTVAR